MAKRAIIAGASGLIGKCLLNLLLNTPTYDTVVILVRKELPIKHVKLIQIVIDFNNLKEYSPKIIGNVFFSCLGTTRLKTPDLNEYRKIDHDYTLQLAEIALMNQVTQFHLVSSMGANAKSFSFYTKIKGEIEDDVIKVGLPSLNIYRPAMLTGVRTEKRPLEIPMIFLMKLIDPLLIGRLKKYRSISADAVADAMYKQSLNINKGVHIYPSDKIKELS